MESFGKNRPPVNPPILDIEDVAAATECTGLIPSALETEDEGENYARLYGIHRQKCLKQEESDS